MSRVVNASEVACALWVSVPTREAGWLVKPVRTLQDLRNVVTWEMPMATGC